MTTLAWIVLIIVILLIAGIITYAITADSPDVAGIIIFSITAMTLCLVIGSEVGKAEKNTEYIPKVVPTLKADSTWQFDTLYYIKKVKK